MSPTEEVPSNRIIQLFSGKTVLITGATGFFGKVLIEKLLRDCPEIRKVYAIVRPKANTTSRQRLENVLLDPLFDTLREQNRAGIWDKLQAIDGDLSLPDLGLSKEDRRKLMDETEIIYHCAATVKFDDPLVETVLLNVRGTKLMLELAQQCQKLMIFCHASTAYCHEDQDIVYERFYEPPANPHEIIKLCETMDSKCLDTLAHWIRGKSVNNYSFSKALSEALIAEQTDLLPVIIQRATAVIPTWKDPVPGWTDNFNGIIGFSAAIGKGVARTIHGDGDYYFDILPVDVTIHGMICTTFDFLTDGSRRIYNLTNSGDSYQNTKDIFKLGLKTVQTRVAFDTFIWYPNCGLTKNMLVHNTYFFLYQLLPAVLLDLILRLFGRKPFLVRIQRKLVNAYRILNYYGVQNWKFDKTNFRAVFHRLNPHEKDVFVTIIEGADIEDYFVNVISGFRRFVFKDKPENAAKALEHVKRMWYVDKIAKTLLLLGFIYYVYSLLFK